MISLLPFLILFFIPLDNTEEKKWLLKILLSFASGGLLGDAFLHLIPHAMMASEGAGGHGHSHSHGHSPGGEGEHGPHDLHVGLGVLTGIVAFLFVEKIVRIYGGGHGHSHGISSSPEKKTEKPKDKSVKKDEKKCEDKIKNSDDEGEGDKKKKKEQDKTTEQEEPIKVGGYLNVFADAFHNFTDGLAIGTSYMAGNTVGFFTTVMIVFHEIPHEIGDYAILIQSGVSPMRAKFLQLVTAVAAIMGCFVALFWHEAGEAAAANFVLPFTAGGFIYIATVSVIPELLEGTTLKQSLCEIFALLVGVIMMIIIAQYE